MEDPTGGEKEADHSERKSGHPPLANSRSANKPHS